jgi:hypothetical protein
VRRPPTTTRAAHLAALLAAIVAALAAPAPDDGRSLGEIPHDPADCPAQGGRPHLGPCLEVDSCPSGHDWDDRNHEPPVCTRCGLVWED